MHNWPERSLSYLCRNFDNLHSGEDFLSVRPVIQIGLLDFTLFENHPEFYATYQFLNVKNYTLYSDKLRLSVLDLTRIDLASKEDKHYHIDYWASLFKAEKSSIPLKSVPNRYTMDTACAILENMCKSTAKNVQGILQLKGKEFVYENHICPSRRT